MRPEASGLPPRRAGTRRVPAPRGQALTEALVAMLLLVPLFVATLQLSQRQAAQQAAQAAARAGLLAAHHGIALPPMGIARQAVDVTVLPSGQPSAAERTEDWAIALLQPAVAVGAGRLDLGRSQARRAVVEARPTALSVPGWGGPEMERPLRAELGALVDDWAAAGAAEVHGRAAALSAAGRLEAWRTPLQLMSAPMRLFEPAVGRLCIGRIDPDIVPADRLPGVSPADADLRTRPC